MLDGPVTRWRIPCGHGGDVAGRRAGRLTRASRALRLAEGTVTIAVAATVCLVAAVAVTAAPVGATSAGVASADATSAGVISVGATSAGVISVGATSAGVISVGATSAGVISVGATSAGAIPASASLDAAAITTSAITTAATPAFATRTVASPASVTFASATRPGAGAYPAALAALDCRTLSHCVAVGANIPTMPDELAADNWNGMAWYRVAMAKPTGSGDVGMAGVACATPHGCVAVGAAYTRSGATFAIAGYWNGTRWRVGKAATPGVASSLAAVSCPAPTSCYAVGQYTPKGSVSWTTLIEHWNGKRWVQQSAPVPHRTSYGALYAVSCGPGTLCVAVGTDGAGGLIERWNGKAWVPTVPRSTANGTLWGVSCPARASCYAVGGDTTGTGAVVQRWNGKKWSGTTVPVPSGGEYPALQSVSCASATACLTVGNDIGNKVFADYWNGKTWKPVSMKASGPHLGYLGQVRCLTAHGCVVLGSVSATSAAWRSESAFWNGRSWKVVPTA